MAEAFVKAASEEGLNFNRLEIRDLQEIPGKGVVGVVDGTHIAVGNKELMREFSANHRDFPDSIHDKHTCVFVSVNNCIASAYCLADDIRGDAVEAVKVLKEDGIHTAILTGDRSSIAGEVAGRLKIDHVYAELLPEDKLRIIDEIRAKHGLVAMVGDGVNDAPALAASDIGIAMGGGGVDVALESADVVLVKDELMMIPYVQRLSKIAVKISKQNIVASLGIKLILGALGFLGFVPLWFAVAAGDDGLTMLVLLNTLRLVNVNGHDDRNRRG
jgi:Cd2+/Zn2+-exporting ATPase